MLVNLGGAKWSRNTGFWAKKRCWPRERCQHL